MGGTFLIVLWVNGGIYVCHIEMPDEGARSGPETLLDVTAFFINKAFVGQQGFWCGCDLQFFSKVPYEFSKRQLMEIFLKYSYLIN